MNAPHPNTPDVAATVPAPPVAEAAPPPVTLATLATFWRSLGYAQASVVPLEDELTAWETACNCCGAVGPWHGLKAVPFYRPGRAAQFLGDPLYRRASMRVAMVCRQCQAAEEL